MKNKDIIFMLQNTQDAVFIMLKNVKMRTIFWHFNIMSWINFMLSWVEEGL